VCESLELSLKGCYRARDLVEQMLTFSRKSKQEQMPLIISPIIRESLKMLERTLPTDIRLHQHIGAASAAVLATPTQIHQIVFNLCINAAHAMRKNAEAPARKTDKPALLSVSLQEDFIDADTVQVHPKIDPGPYLRLTVKDTGHGIPPEIMDRIFDPFFTTKNPGEGTGMGLAVVHGILKGIRGGVRVESAPDKGSVFDVFLPVFEGGKKFDSTDKSPALLIVDDKAFLSETLQNSHHSKF
jgi:signal transduction histidine kinase